MNQSHVVYFSVSAIATIAFVAQIPYLTALEGEDPEAGKLKKVEIANKVLMEFCYIPPGETKLGSIESERSSVAETLKRFDKNFDKNAGWLWFESGRKPRSFKSKGFWLGKYEVTQGEWKAVMGHNPSFFSKDLKGVNVDRFPVDSVLWNDCQEFLKILNKRQVFIQTFGKSAKCVLPHEDEWEYAYRGGKGNDQPYYWGKELNGKQANCNGEQPFGTDKKDRYLMRPCAVDETNGGEYAVHPWGLCHMSGNVCEWCENLYSSPDKYNQCGGSFFDAAWNCRAVSRFPDVQSPPGQGEFYKTTFGFRVCIRLE